MLSFKSLNSKGGTTSGCAVRHTASAVFVQWTIRTDPWSLSAPCAWKENNRRPSWWSDLGSVVL